MNSVRYPAVSGTFYLENKHELQQSVQEYINAAKNVDKIPKAVIAPHAGYIYSGPIAGSSYSIFKNNTVINNIVLIGPSHRVAFRGIAIPDCQYFSTPLGSVPINDQQINELESFSYVTKRNDAHRLEHSLEVQLPFLQTLFSEFTLVPIVIGDIDYQSVTHVLDMLWGNKETLVVVSSDLSHFLPYDEAQMIDQKTTQAIESFDSTQIDHHQACGSIGINGLLKKARELAMEVKTIDLRNSGDTAGSKDRVVGYGAYHFYE